MPLCCVCGCWCQRVSRPSYLPPAPSTLSPTCLCGCPREGPISLYCAWGSPVHLARLRNTPQIVLGKAGCLGDIFHPDTAPSFSPQGPPGPTGPPGLIGEQGIPGARVSSVLLSPQLKNCPGLEPTESGVHFPRQSTLNPCTETGDPDSGH